MMKQCIVMMAVIFCTALFSSCEQNIIEESFSDEKQEIIFNLGILQTRTVTTDKKTLFIDKDQVGIFGLKRGTADILHENLHYTYNQGEVKWEAERSITFPIDGSNLSFYAYYPYVPNITGTSFEFSVAQDQSEKGYNQSDLLLAKNETATVDDKEIMLSFAHKLAMVEVKVILPEGKKIEKIDIRAKRTATVDLVQGKVLVNTDATAEYITMQPLEDDQNLFRAVLPAQIIDKGKMLRMLSDDGTIYWYKVTDSIEFAINKVTTFTIDCTNKL